jgi:hypothetical protein
MPLAAGLSAIKWSFRSKFLKIWCSAAPLKNKKIKGTAAHLPLELRGRHVPVHGDAPDD